MRTAESVVLTLWPPWPVDAYEIAPGLAEVLTQGLFVLRPMSTAGLRESITRPAELAGVTREPGLVESALASAANTFHYGGGDLFDIAASYAFHVAESQAFVDGNKRTGVAAAMIFLVRNGLYAQPAKWELYLAMIDVAKKQKTKADLAEIFRRCASNSQ